VAMPNKKPSSYESSLMCPFTWLLMLFAGLSKGLRSSEDSLSANLAAVQRSERVNIFVYQACKSTMLLLNFMMLIIRTKNSETSLMDKP
jgi:hypothetical protein